jgi:hypothetical protein
MIAVLFLLLAWVDDGVKAVRPGLTIDEHVTPQEGKGYERNWP